MTAPSNLIVAALLLTSIASVNLRGQGIPVWVVTRLVPVGNTTSLDCADGNNCMMGGWTGNMASYILRTTDAGRNWDTVFLDTASYPPLHIPLRTQFVSFPTRNFAIVAGDSGVFTRSTDGGQTWVQYQVPGLPDKHTLSVRMCDQQNGIISFSDKTTHRSELYRTTDGGNSWDSVPIPISSGKIEDVACISPRRYVCLHIVNQSSWKNTVFRTNDGGKTWNSFAFPLDSNLHWPRMAFADSLNGWMSMGLEFPYQYNSRDYTGLRCVVWHTTDGGEHWFKQLDTLRQPYQYALMNSGLDGISFADSLNGLVAGELTIFRTMDGGGTWNFELMDTNQLYGTLRVSYRRPGKGIITDGVYVFVPGETVSVEESHQSGWDSFPYLVYPNPAGAGSRVSVRLYLQKQSRVCIELWDVSGHIVMSRTDRPMPTGEHTVEINLGQLRSGMYYGRVILNGRSFVQTIQVR